MEKMSSTLRDGKVFVVFRYCSKPLILFVEIFAKVKIV